MHTRVPLQSVSLPHPSRTYAAGGQPISAAAKIKPNRRRNRINNGCASLLTNVLAGKREAELMVGELEPIELAIIAAHLANECVVEAVALQIGAKLARDAPHPSDERQRFTVPRQD